MFQGPVLQQLAEYGRSTVIDRVLSSADLWDWFKAGRPLENAFESAYAVLRQRYRSEYLYKNAIAQKILLGRHSLRTAMLVPELRVGTCRADIVVVNGTSTVYEIKSGLDNLERLGSQVNCYRQAFDRICVVTEQGNENRIAEIVDPAVGILVLTNRYSIKTVREARSNKSRVVPSTIFDLLREREYMQIIRNELGSCPDLPNGIRYSACRELFQKISPERAHAGMVQALRNRAATPGFADFVNSLPRSLKAAGFGVRLNRTQRAQLLLALAKEYPLSSRYEPIH